MTDHRAGEEHDDMDGWVEPDGEVLDHLTRLATFGADAAVMAAWDRPSSVPGPDGRPQRLTAAETTHVAVRAALRVLMANGLIEAKLPDGAGPMVQLDPPGGWDA